MTRPTGGTYEHGTCGLRYGRNDDGRMLPAPGIECRSEAVGDGEKALCFFASQRMTRLAHSGHRNRGRVCPLLE